MHEITDRLLASVSGYCILSLELKLKFQSYRKLRLTYYYFILVTYYLTIGNVYVYVSDFDQLFQLISSTHNFKFSI